MVVEGGWWWREDGGRGMMVVEGGWWWREWKEREKGVDRELINCSKEEEEHHCTAE